jgi:hypothetical protein
LGQIALRSCACAAAYLAESQNFGAATVEEGADTGVDSVFCVNKWLGKDNFAAARCDRGMDGRGQTQQVTNEQMPCFVDCDAFERIHVNGRSEGRDCRVKMRVRSLHSCILRCAFRCASDSGDIRARAAQQSVRGDVQIQIAIGKQIAQDPENGLTRWRPDVDMLVKAI